MQLIKVKRSIPKSRTKLQPIFIRDGQYITKIISTSTDKDKAYHLRHSVFCEELGWVPTTGNSCEVDGYDEYAVFMGVFDQRNNLKAFLRVVLPADPYMLEGEFPYLVGQGYQIRKELDTAEISRLCVEPGARTETVSGNFGVHFVSMMLYKGLYQWCLKKDIRFLYLVVEEKVYRLLCAKRFPCKPIGEPRIMPDGVIAVAAILDWREFEKTCEIKQPKMLAWFRPNQANLPLARLRQRESDSPHPAFS